MNTVLGKPLSKKEHQTYSLMIEGYLNSEIAHKAGVNVHTVNRHITMIFKKLGIKNREERKKFRSLYARQ